MSDRNGIFAGDDPFDIARNWLEEARQAEVNDPEAMALATVDPSGLPDVRIVLLKEITGQRGDGEFLFYTNYESAKSRQIDASGLAAFVLHWKSLRRQIRVRGSITRLDPGQSDAYYQSRPLESRIGAWASRQSSTIASRGMLIDEVSRQKLAQGLNPSRPERWGGYRIRPKEIEFWSDGAFRLHDRFRWVKADNSSTINELDDHWENVCESLWKVARLSP